MHEVEKPTGGSSVTRAKVAEIIYTIIELAQRKKQTKWRTADTDQKIGAEVNQAPWGALNF